MKGQSQQKNQSYTKIGELAIIIIVQSTSTVSISMNEKVDIII